MLRSMRCISLVGLLLTVVTLSGCPGVTTPGLSVTPLALNFGTGETSKTIRIQNTGGGTLTWAAEVSASAPWLTLEVDEGTKQANMVEGESTTEVDVVTVLLNTTLLAQSSSRNATVSVTSNGGSQDVNIGVSETGPPQLNLSPTSLAFGTTEATMDVAISNGGAEALNWSLTIPDDVPWLSASRTSNTGIIGDTVDTVTFTVDRTGLPGGDYQTTVSVTTNGGDGDILITLSVPPLIVSSDAIDFGSLLQDASRFVNISNPSETIAGVDITTDVAGAATNWLSIADGVDTIDPRTTETIRVDASPAGLVPGVYNGTVTIEAANVNFTHVITVRMEVPGLSVTPDLLEFGEITESQQQSFTLENLTGSPLAYAIDVPTDAPWVLLSSASGTLDTTVTIQLTADPDLIGAGSHEAVLSISFGDSATSPTQSLTVRMSRPEPARLEASPKSILFGTALLERRVALWNVGIGTVNWEIDGSDFPAWLSLDVASGSGLIAAGVATGTVSGEATDEVLLRVDRSMAPAGEFEFSHTFDAVASGDADNTVSITLSMTIARTAAFAIEADDVDDRGISTLAIPVTEDTRTFVVRNEGTGPLNWAFGELPFWITSLDPSQGTLEPNVQQTVTLTVSRDGLFTPGEQEFLEITTNDPERELVLLDVAVAVPPVISITAIPAGGISFADDESAKTLEIANDGDPGTLLNYQVATNQEWLSISPSNGVSEGTSSPIKDFQQHSVTVDRSRLEGAGASARIIISAFLVEDGETVPDPTVPPLEVTVTVEAAPLTIESALPRKRVPSLLRNVVAMRNIRSESIPIPNSRLTEVGDLFRIAEAEVPLELTESNQFLKRDYSANVLILLDFSGSMFASAQEAVDDGQLGDPAALTEDVLKSVYAQSIVDLIDEMPDHFRVGLAVFNDRPTPDGGAIRIVTNTNDGEPDFTRDKVVLGARFSSLIVNDNGATDLLPAIEAGSTRLVREDTNSNLRPFDDADMRALIVVTDGRDTSLERIAETSNAIIAQGVRLFMVGWGSSVEADPIIRLATATGGHYYSTPARDTGLQDPFGVPIRVPEVAELADWCTLDTSDECDQSIANDLSSQVLLSYTALNAQPSVIVTADLTFNDPNDQNTLCLPEQGDITSGVEWRQQDFLAVQGDTRLGQVSLRTEGVDGGSASLVLRADYVPRNITEFTFDIGLMSIETPTVTVTPVPQTAGGLISNWTSSVAGTEYTFASPDGTPIRFSDFGDLLDIQVDGVTQAFDLTLEITDPAYDGSEPETKYITHPTGMTVGGGEFLATSFPAPFFNSRPSPLDLDGTFIVDVDTDTDQVEIDVFNLGGSHVDENGTTDIVTGEYSAEGLVNVGLAWEATIGASDSFLTFTDDSQRSGFVTDYATPSTMVIDLNRDLTPPGEREGEVFVTYGSGSVNSTGVLEPLVVRYTIELPEFDIDVFNTTTQEFEDLPGLFINFEATPDAQDIRVSNAGQSTLQWRVDEDLLPSWLVLSDVGGAATEEFPSVLTISIVRESLPLGNQFADIVFTADFVDPITLTVSAEGVPPAP
jgi:hypothetical protein